MDKNYGSEFLQPGKGKLIYWLIEQQNEVFIQDDSEKGKFKKEFFPAIELPTVVYVLWVEYLFRILSAIYEKVCTMIKRKLNAEVYEPSNSFYQLKQFCIIKKNKKSLRIIHSLELLDRIIIAYSGLSPAMEELAMYFIGRAYHRILNLYVRYNKQILSKHS